MYSNSNSKINVPEARAAMRNPETLETRLDGLDAGETLFRGPDEI